MAYSRPIWRSTIERCPLLRKLCKALFSCKTLRKWIEKGGRVKFLGPFFFKKMPFFHKKCPFLANIEHCSKFIEYALLIDMSAPV